MSAGSFFAHKGVKEGGVGEWLETGAGEVGGWVGVIGEWGVFFCLVYPAEEPMDPDTSHLLYPPNSPTSCPGWNDVTSQLGMSRPHPPISSACPLAPLLSTRLQSLASHCDPGLSMQHVPTLMERQPGTSSKHKSEKACKRGNETLIYTKK